MDVRRRGALVAAIACAAALPLAPRVLHADARPASASASASTSAPASASASAPASASASASDAAEPATVTAASPTTGRRVLAGAAAIVPGVIVRGAGHFVAGDRKTAKRLLMIEGAGLLLAAAGGIPIGLSGAAGETMPGLALLLPGTALLFTSVAADVWGAAGGASIAGEPLMPDALALSLGYTAVVDPRLPFTNVATAAIDARRGRALLAASGWSGDGGWRAGATAGVRIAGPRPAEGRAGDLRGDDRAQHDAPGDERDDGERGPARRDASSVDVVVAASHEDRAAAGYAINTFEGAVRGRLELVRLAPSLRGSHVRAGLGAGVERIGYEAVDVTDVSGLITGHFAWGFTLGDGHARALEAELYYEHRRDTLAGGVTLPTPGNGFIGYFGATATAWRDRWGLTATAEAGSAWVFSLALRARFPELP